VKRHPALIPLAVCCLYIAAAGSNAYAQSPVVNTTTATAAGAPASASTLFSALHTASNSVQLTTGAGSDDDNKGYIIAKGYFFHVRRGTNPAFFEGAPTAATVAAITDFSYGTEFAPKIEGGYNGTGGWGFPRKLFLYKSEGAHRCRGNGAAQHYLDPAVKCYFHRSSASGDNGYFP
jgi:hypothetical protein